MPMTPIYSDVFHIPKNKLAHLEIIAGLDRGCSLTKLVYLAKKKEGAPADDGDTYALHTALFLNKDMEDALDFLKEEADLPKEGNFHVTGAGGTMFMKMISEKLGLTAVCVNEFLSHCHGTHFLVNNIPINDLIFDDAENEEDAVFGQVQRNEIMKKMMEGFSNKATISNDEGSQSKPFPALFAFLGSGAGMVQIDEEKTFRMLTAVTLGGKAFIGLSKLLVGTTDYDQIMALAEAGNRCNVDTQIKDVLKVMENSPYGHSPPELPIFSFGKASEPANIGKKYAKEDVAASFVALVAISMANTIMSICKSLELANVYIGGHLFRGRLFRKEMRNAIKLWGQKDKINIYCLKTGHTAAIGAMICNPGDEMKYYRM